MVHTTNYINTFIEVAEDCPATKGEIPPFSEQSKSVARLQFEILSEHPYQFTSDDIAFQVFAERNGLTGDQLQNAKAQFFSKGQPCLRSSPLTKRYGWGIHCDEQGKVAMYGVETEEYRKLSTGKTLKVVKAMRSKRA